LIVGGIVFRVVTASHPGDPKLDEAGAPPIRTEYLLSDDPESWTMVRDKAFIFETHLVAEIVAKKLGGRCHVSVAAPRELKSISEQLRPRPEASVTAAADRKSKIRIDPFRAAQCRRDPVEVE
jgi:hypothetical protein